jgi:hypothetical protein
MLRCPPCNYQRQHISLHRRYQWLIRQTTPSRLPWTHTEGSYREMRSATTHILGNSSPQRQRTSGTPRRPMVTGKSPHRCTQRAPTAQAQCVTLTHRTPTPQIWQTTSWQPPCPGHHQASPPRLLHQPAAAGLLTRWCLRMPQGLCEIFTHGPSWLQTH